MFWPKSSVNPFEKKPMWRLWKIIFLQYRRACFLPQRSSKHYFQAHFVQEQTKRKFSFFDQNHGLTLLTKIPILLQKGKFPIFLQNHELRPSKKILVWQLCKINIFLVLVGFFVNYMIVKHYFNAHLTEKQNDWHTDWLTDWLTD